VIYGSLKQALARVSHKNTSKKRKFCGKLSIHTGNTTSYEEDHPSPVLQPNSLFGCSSFFSLNLALSSAVSRSFSALIDPRLPSRAAGIGLPAAGVWYGVLKIINHNNLQKHQKE
jgi:hypothetical protein